MRMLLLLVVASLAGACVVDEPIGEPEAMSWSEGEIEVDGERDIGRRPPRDDCVANVRACLASGLSREPGGQPGSSRCVDCLDICQRSNWWPDETWYGGDCKWWNY